MRAKKLKVSSRGYHRQHAAALIPDDVDPVHSAVKRHLPFPGLYKMQGPHRRVTTQSSLGGDVRRSRCCRCSRRRRRWHLHASPAAIFAFGNLIHGLACPKVRRRRRRHRALRPCPNSGAARAAAVPLIVFAQRRLRNCDIRPGSFGWLGSPGFRTDLMPMAQPIAWIQARVYWTRSEVTLCSLCSLLTAFWSLGSRSTRESTTSWMPGSSCPPCYLGANGGSY